MQQKPAESTAAPAASATPMGEEYRGVRRRRRRAANAGGGILALHRPAGVPHPLRGLRGPFGIEDSVGAAGPLLAIAGSRFKLHGELHGRGTLHPFPLLHVAHPLAARRPVPARLRAASSPLGPARYELGPASSCSP
ncbi:hypothetical protein PAHAL_4G182600 [Panicum hallii]|jgi:hypothetical protein|uniref:Uncharacterized protein n=1 Tax=Panicum hallii TaxID=206008 RepID=A0A2S3HJE6_9POAL|nr:hypothetical protein PAHAL_4G182600 [Panicum hallii]